MHHIDTEKASILIKLLLRSNIILFQLQRHFARFLYTFLFVFSQMKDTKDTRRDFQSVAWVMP